MFDMFGKKQREEFMIPGQQPDVPRPSQQTQQQARQLNLSDMLNGLETIYGEILEIRKAVDLNKDKIEMLANGDIPKLKNAIDNISITQVVVEAKEVKKK